jgi:GNAT superfamily N-acetyltransferase
MVARMKETLFEPGGTLNFDAPTAEELVSDRDFFALYEASFPPDQREPVEVMVKTIRTGRGVVIRARSAGQTIGLASAHLLERPPAVFLVYLAVRPESRGRRIGSALFERIWQTGAARLEDRRLIPQCYTWEVEKPELAADDTARALARKRIAFFQRCGGRELLPGYYQPPVNGPVPVPMLLMAKAAESQPMPPAHHLVYAIYFEKYGAANGIPAETLAPLLESSLQSAATPPKREG